MSQIHTMGDDPFVATEQAADKLYGEIQRELPKLDTQAWPALQARTSELIREVNGGISQMSRLREDVRERPELRVDLAASFDKLHGATRAKAESLRKDATATLDILRAEVLDKARPRVTPEREAFVRQDLAALLDHSSDPLRDMVDIAGGAHRDRAALVVSDFSDPYLSRLFPDKRTREQFREGLGASMLEGSIKHGTETERAAATAAKTILPKTAGWVAARITPAMAKLKSAESLRP
jgi:hypothetical protein